MKKLYKKLRTFFHDESRKMNRNDWIIVGVFVVGYALLSFYNLGSTKNPQTFTRFDHANEEANIEILGDTREISKVRHYSGDEVGSYRLLGSIDGENYFEVGTMEDQSVFLWSDTEIGATLKYFRIVSNQGGSYIGEIQLYDQYGEKIAGIALDDGGKALIDEPDVVPNIISYMNSTYFDEIYFARSAYEYLHNIQVLEWVHPPVGKLIQMIPIFLFGMSTFAYRLMGNIAGILMIAVMYYFAKVIFKSRKFAFVAAALMSFDNFHFAQTRLGTVDSFLVLFMMVSALFMYKYLLLDKYDSIRPKLKYLSLSGLFFGLATCVKWTGLYFGLGLCILFFGKLILDFIKDRKVSDQYKKIIPSCILFFVVIPIVIYIASYFLFPNVYPREVNSFQALFSQIKDMFAYHSGLQEPHDFSSKWYTWPLMIKPVWYYVAYPSEGLKSTIVAIGNPVIWWTGIVAVIYVFVQSIKERKCEYIFLIVLVLSLWLPYAFIGRVMFLYHYFPVIPFLMLSIVAMLKYVCERLKNIWIAVVYLAIVVIVFAWFYPVVSGTVMPETYIDSLKWLSTWIF